MKSASTHPIVADVSGERNLHPRVGVGGAKHEEDGVVVELGVEDAAEEHAESVGGDAIKDNFHRLSYKAYYVRSNDLEWLPHNHLRSPADYHQDKS